MHQTNHWIRRNLGDNGGLCISTRPGEPVRWNGEGYRCASFPFFTSICKTASYPFLGPRVIVPEDCTGNDLNNGELQDLKSQLGHLYVGPQSKSRYVSAGFFAMISQEARLLYRTYVAFLLTLRRLQKLITCSSSNSNTHWILSFAFRERIWTTLRKPDRIVVARWALMMQTFTARVLQDNSVAIYFLYHPHGA